MRVKVLAIGAALLLMLTGLVGCSDKNNVDNPDVTSTPAPTETIPQEPTMISKEELGISFELPYQYSDCQVVDAVFTREEYEGLSVVGGFDITYGSKKNEETIATVFVATKDSLDDSPIRTRCNFILTGIDYSVAAIVPENSTVSLEDDDYTTITNLKDGVIDILATLFFDESVLAPGEFGGDSEPKIDINSNTPESNDTDGAGEIPIPEVSDEPVENGGADDGIGEGVAEDIDNTD